MLYAHVGPVPAPIYPQQLMGARFHSATYWIEMREGNVMVPRMLRRTDQRTPPKPGVVVPMLERDAAGKVRSAMEAVTHLRHEDLTSTRVEFYASPLVPHTHEDYSLQTGGLDKSVNLFLRFEGADSRPFDLACWRFLDAARVMVRWLDRTNASAADLRPALVQMRECSEGIRNDAVGRTHNPEQSGLALTEVLTISRRTGLYSRVKKQYDLQTRAKLHARSVYALQQPDAEGADTMLFPCFAALWVAQGWGAEPVEGAHRYKLVQPLDGTDDYNYFEATAVMFIERWFDWHFADVLYRVATQGSNPLPEMPPLVKALHTLFPVIAGTTELSTRDLYVGRRGRRRHIT